MMETPKANGKDIAYKGTKITLATTAAGLATLTAGPGIAALLAAGGAAFAVELFSQTFTPSLEKRREKWFEAIAEKLGELEEKVDEFNFESLTENEQFVTTLIQATQIAIRNHQEEKLTALRNAVLNAALPNPIQEDLQIIFLNWIDRLSNYHIQVLTYLDNPGTSPNRKIPTIKDYEGKSLVIQVANDLEDLGLVELESSLLQRGLEHSDEKRVERLLKDGNIESAFKIVNKKTDELKELKAFLEKIERGFGESHTTSLGKLFIQFLKLPYDV
jgi:hypothetical protein